MANDYGEPDTNIEVITVGIQYTYIHSNGDYKI